MRRTYFVLPLLLLLIIELHDAGTAAAIETAKRHLGWVEQAAVPEPRGEKDK